jgi:hypothetical protein
MLINPADIATVADGALVNAVWAVRRVATIPRSQASLSGWLDKR